MNQYKINLQTDNSGEPYELNGDNIGKITIKSDRVFMELSKNGLLGLGTELIKLALKYEEGYHTHLRPITSGLVSQNMGIYLTADSTEVVIICDDKGKIEDYNV